MCTLQHCRQQDAVLPTVTGVAIEKLDAWWSSHMEEVTAQLSSFALEVVTPGAIMVSRDFWYLRCRVVETWCV